MNEELLAQVEEYIRANYRERNIKFSIRLEEPAEEYGEKKEKKKEPVSWSERWKKTFDSLFSRKPKEDTFAERLWKLIDERGRTDVDVYKKAHLDRRLFSKIRKDKKYNPSRNTAISLAIALELNMEETSDLLRRAGCALSESHKEDVIIMYFIEHQQYDIFLINEVLEHYDLPLLGGREK